MTRKEIAKNFNKVISISYCEAQSLLRNECLCGSNVGKYGWNYDVFAVGDVAICAGQSSMPGTRVAHGLVKEYDDRAFAIWEHCYLSDEQKREIVKNLLSEFVSKSCK